MFSDLYQKKQEEQRIDPEDGELRTKQELLAACAGLYSPEEVENYWNTQCKPVGAQHSVANDPFLTHAGLQERQAPSAPPGAPQGAGAEMADLNANPFLTRGEEQNDGNLRPDPFLTRNTPRQEQQARSGALGWPPTRGRSGQFMDEASAAVARAKDFKHWTEVAGKLLGEGDPDRKPSARTIFVFAPWALFVLEVFLWVCLRHFSLQATIVLTVIAAIAGLCLMVLWMIGKRWGPTSLLALGVLLLLAVTLGSVIGDAGWDHYWRQNWWFLTGRRSLKISATTPAGSQSDAAVVGFVDEATGLTMNGTSVDLFKSAGYKDGSYYCVAPILNADAASSENVEVNYWAIGIDCCQYLGSFTCDASRSITGGYGAVMLDHGYPCPGCNGEKFKKAVLKAESMHGLVSAPGAVFVRFVSSPSNATGPSMLKSVFFIILSAIISLGVFWVLGSITWYYGLGKRESYREPLLSGVGFWSKQVV